MLTASQVQDVTENVGIRILSSSLILNCLFMFNFGFLQELNNPILFLDVMRWCWQADFRNRPSASVLEKVVTNPSFSRLVDAVPLSSTCLVTASCICTTPLAIVAQEGDGEDGHNKPSYVANADLQVCF